MLMPWQIDDESTATRRAAQWPSSSRRWTASAYERRRITRHAGRAGLAGPHGCHTCISPEGTAGTILVDNSRPYLPTLVDLGSGLSR